jgi:hypothetical protein
MPMKNCLTVYPSNFNSKTLESRNDTKGWPEMKVNTFWNLKFTYIIIIN